MDSITQSPVGSNHSDIDKSQDIVYQARSVPTNGLDEKKEVTRDGSIDSESAGV